MSSTAEPSPPEESEALPPGRRRFLCAIAGAGAAAIGLSLVATPVIVTLGPAFSGDAGADAELWLRLGPPTRFPVGGPPTRVVLRRDERDAWLMRERVPLGVVYIQRPTAETFTVHSGACPHLGCAVSFSGERFVCPCHGATFAKDGALGPAADGGDNPAKRGLDTLEARLAGGELEVRWQRFRLDTADKEAVS